MSGEAEVPWSAAKLASVLTAVVYEHFINGIGAGLFTFCADGRDEKYELLDAEDEDSDVLTFERKADGVRFDVSFWVNVSAAASGGAP